MTEGEWLTSEDPEVMLLHFSAASTVPHHRPPSPRKLRLWMAAVWPLVAAGDGSGYHGPAGRRMLDRLVGKLHRMADAGDGPGQNHVTTLKDAHYAALRVCRHVRPEMAAPAARLLREVVGNPWRDVGPSITCGRCGGSGGGDDAFNRCRDCGGHGVLQMRPWMLSAKTLEVAEEAYWSQDRQACPFWEGCSAHGSAAGGCDGDGVAVWGGRLDPVRLGVLSDALLDDGCNDEGLLGHLRSPGPHVRGCWALDLILGR